MRERGKGRWQIAASAGADPITGRRRQVWRWVHGSRSDAQKALAALVLEIDQSQGARGADATVDQLIAEYLSVAELAVTTRSDFDRVRAKLLPKRLAAMPVWQVRGHDLDAVYAGLLREGWSSHRVSRLHILLSAAFGRAVRWRWIVRNPAEDARPPVPPAPLAHAPHVDDIRRLIEAADPPFDLYLRLAFVTGCRRGELCALQWGDVGESLLIRRAVVYVPETGLVTKATKSGRERLVAIDSTTQAWIAKHRADEEAQLLAPITPSVFVFTSAVDGVAPWRPDYVTWMFGRLRSDVGVSCRLHDIRHGSVTSGLQAGHDLVTVSKRAGHARPSMTSDRYAHSSSSQDQALAATLGSMLE